MTTLLGPFITDHKEVIATLNIKKVQPKQEAREIRKLHDVTEEEWMTQLTQCDAYR